MALVVQHPSMVKAGKKKPKEELPIHESSFLMAASYDSEMMQMTVTMKGGSQYVYNYIYPSTFEEFKLAKDKSKYYADKIRGQNKSSRTIDKTIGKPISKKAKK